MSLYDKATIVQIPSGVKSGTLYNVLPNTADGDFDFTRATSATRVNKDGLIESVASGVPKLDYPLLDGVVQSCPALLLEPNRTNNAPYSEDFTGWGITSSGTTLTSNSAISPDGNQTADLLESDGTNAFARVFDAVSLTSGNNCLYSVFVKKSGSHDFASIRVAGTDVGGAGQTGSTYTFTFSTETLSNVGGGTATSTFVENYGSGWYRIGMEVTNSTITEVVVYPKFNSSVAGEILMWGAQLEEGSYPTSYIPTSGSTVTRHADQCIDAGTSAEVNDSEGVLFTEMKALIEGEGTRAISISAPSSTNNRVMIRYTSTDGELNYQVRTDAGGSLQNTVNAFKNIGNTVEYTKIAGKYKSNDLALWVNGFEIFTDTTGSTMPTGMTELGFEDGNLGNRMFAGVKQAMVFNEALTDSELEQITSWRSFDEMAKGQLYTIE